MIVDEQRAQVTGKIEGDVARMTIDPDQMGHIMEVLTNAYSDPERAVLREYSTNARDAHVEAGNPAPIQVRLPSRLDPYLRIQDFGVGLLVEDIHMMYSRYGASTKRDTNEQTGMLGIGSKSGLAYADSFTLTSNKDGRQVQVLVSRDEDGAGQMNIVADLATDEPNGTTVTIQAARDHRLHSHAADLFRWWPEGTVLVDGEAPRRFTGLKLADDVYVSEEGANHTVVMGNVPYPADDYLDDRLPDRFRRSSVRLVAFVPLGSVMPAPSREALRYTRKTKATLDAIVERYADLARSSVQREADAADTPFAALSVIAEWSDRLPGAPKFSEYTYKGAALPDNYDPPGGSVMVMSTGRYSTANASRMKGINAATFPKVVWVANFVPGKSTQSHRRKLLAWCDAKPMTHPDQFVLLPGEAPTSDFIDPDRIADWKDVRSIKLERDSNGLGYSASYLTGRLSGSYDLFVGTDRRMEVPANDVKNLPKPLMYAWGNVRRGRGIARDIVDWIGHERFTLVMLPINRMAKFQRDFPEATDVSTVRKAEYTKFVDAITPDQKRALHIYDAERHYRFGVGDTGSSFANLNLLDPDRIDDPDLTAAVRSAKVDVTAITKRRSAFGEPVPRTDWKCPLHKYPLFNPQMADDDHTYIYLNAAYAASQETA
jgi:hypothetical protein